VKVFDTNQSRFEYFAEQVSRSSKKFGFCKVSIYDSLKYQELITKYLELPTWKLFPTLLCMGSRNGREVDLFRLVMCQSPLKFPIKLTEVHRAGFWSPLDFLLLSFGRFNLNRLKNGGSFGVEINPQAQRKDIHIGSFDQLPEAWESKIDVIYSNSFDQSQDPYRTAKEWLRVLRKGGLLFFAGNSEQANSLHDPVGEISLKDIVSLFPGDLMYHKSKGSRSGYTETIIRKT